MTKLWDIESRPNLIDLLWLIFIVNPYPFLYLCNWIHEMGVLDEYIYVLILCNWAMLEFLGLIFISIIFFMMCDIRYKKKRPKIAKRIRPR